MPPRIGYSVTQESRQKVLLHHSRNHIDKLLTYKLKHLFIPIIGYFFTKVKSLAIPYTFSIVGL